MSAVRAERCPGSRGIRTARASGLPIFIGAAFGELGLGLAASLGGLVFLHLPATRLSHRMAWLMACAFGMTASHALGLLGHLVPALVVPLLVTSTLSLFFVMAAAIGAYSPVHGRDELMQVGAVALGTVLAVAIAFVYSLYIDVSRRGVPAPNPPPQPDFDVVVTDSVGRASARSRLWALHLRSPTRSSRHRQAHQRAAGHARYVALAVMGSLARGKHD